MSSESLLVNTNGTQLCSNCQEKKQSIKLTLLGSYITQQENKEKQKEANHFSCFESGKDVFSTPSKT